jgi:acyl dehydratase
MGDANPLFVDEEYAKKTKYGNIIAPGTYLYTIQWTHPGAGGPGIHGWYVGGDWEWYRPIFVGDEFKVVAILRDFTQKKGKMGGGRTWLDYGDVIYINQNEEIVGKEYCHFVWAERGASGSSGKYRATPKPIYTKEDWERILELYVKEELRGAEPRYWEDVEVGDKIGPMIKGPLSVRDEIGWLMGAGSPFFRVHKIEFDYERRHPKVLEYVEEIGEADVPEMVHILDPYAHTIGVERAYDYGSQRESWLGQLFTNWISDDGFLWKMSADERVFNQVGDLTTLEGKVTKKYMEEGKCCIDIEAWAKNQRDEWSIPPHMSTVILPSKEHGPVVYPKPSPQLIEEVSKARPLDELIKEGLI